MQSTKVFTLRETYCSGMETQDKKRLELQKRFANQKDYDPLVFVYELVKATQEDIREEKISAEKLAARFEPEFRGSKMLLYDAAAALEEINAPPFITMVLKYHPKREILEIVSHLGFLGLAEPYTTKLAEIPDSILFCYAWDWWVVKEHINKLVRFGKFKTPEAQERGLKLFGGYPNLAIAPRVLESNKYLRGFYTFMWVTGKCSAIFSMALGEIFFGRKEENENLVLDAPTGAYTGITIKPNPRLIAHGRVGEKYWVFFLME